MDLAGLAERITGAGRVETELGGYQGSVERFFYWQC